MPGHIRNLLLVLSPVVASNMARALHGISSNGVVRESYRFSVIESMASLPSLGRLGHSIHRALTRGHDKLPYQGKMALRARIE